MQLKLATALALLPYIVSATPAPAASGTKISLTKRSTITTDGVVNIAKLQNHVETVRGFVDYHFTVAIMN